MTQMGIISALAGLAALAFLQSADPTTGQGFELLVIASTIIGGTALTGGSGSVPGALPGRGDHCGDSKWIWCFWDFLRTGVWWQQGL